ncbi:GDA1/CD39 (nucleoside phosphatase) family protein [Clavispora lusitaniae]|uniref:GDA1/CD39 (nucleoside phosphatase) family protein n=1 Tax=Clavispora lusitaniae TaxID=36911 RepID=UPI00169B0470|nr:hypothetical protein E0198_003738 [Clavispora lusitaniae]KAF7581447.1 GDA1/CD39 (nucleoside phosphatase) family protein [Clavispora lusitaniae]
MPQIFPRKKKKVIKPGPVTTKDGIPLDYIVVIDSGSKGSRVYVYNWLNPQHAFEAGIDISMKPKIKLHRRMSFGKERPEDDNSDLEESDTDSALESDPNSLDSTKPDPKRTVRLPFVNTKKRWHRKMSPGLASFNESPGKVGNHHLSYLLSLASSVVPKSEHYRTPIFLHATAGMRLLPPNEQEPIMENVCQYLQSNSDFYLPHCQSHVNIIDGDTEGLYGWLSINYLMNSLDHPEDHDHGKNHTTYGLLDMGGASTQVVFQPNTTESEEHSNNLYHVLLSEIPKLLPKNTTVTQMGNYSKPQTLNFDVYSDSFLGFGMFQAHHRYRKLLLEQFRHENDLPGEVYSFRTPIPDPCLPKGYTTSDIIDDHNLDFVGESNFDKCLQSIFPVLANATHGAGTGTDTFNGDCQSLDATTSVSSCLLSDLIPAFDFDINHFVGVSGYWDAINQILTTESISHKANKTDKYDYTLIYSKSKQLCQQPLQDLLTMNEFNKGKAHLQQDDLVELCFKSSWILNFLHVGLGFPRFGIDDIPNKDEKFKSLQLVDKMGSRSFSWTLGRALLYANDEYVQAFNNYSSSVGSDSDSSLKRPGYYYTAAVGSYYFGAEFKDVPPRPQYVPASPDAKYIYYDYENSYKQGKESKWYIKPHRFYGEVVFIVLFFIAVLLMLGRERRSAFVQKVKGLFSRKGAYSPVNNDTFAVGDDPALELEEFPPSSSKSRSPDDEITIGSSHDT